MDKEGLLLADEMSTYSAAHWMDPVVSLIGWRDSGCGLNETLGRLTLTDACPNILGKPQHFVNQKELDIAWSCQNTKQFLSLESKSHPDC
jgi:hypothetical protein